VGIDASGVHASHATPRVFDVPSEPDTFVTAICEIAASG
jgi:hypothetical protein